MHIDITSKFFCLEHKVHCNPIQGRTGNNQGYLTTIPVDLGFLGDFELLKLKPCSFYHENIFIQKFKVISSQFLNNFFSAPDIMKAVSGRFRFYGMNAI